MNWQRGLVRLAVIVGTLVSAAVLWTYLAYQQSDLAYSISVHIDPLYVAIGTLLALGVAAWIVRGFFRGKDSAR